MGRPLRVDLGPGELRVVSIQNGVVRAIDLSDDLVERIAYAVTPLLTNALKAEMERRNKQAAGPVSPGSRAEEG